MKYVEEKLNNNPKAYVYNCSCTLSFDLQQ